MKTLKFLSRIAFIFIILFNVVALEELRDDFWITTYTGKRYYVEIRYNYNWFEAYIECISNNLQLIVLDNAEKNEDLVRYLKVKLGFSRNLWIGAHDQFNKAIDKNRPFVWIPNGNVMTYSNWFENNPTNTGGVEHCAQIWEHTPNFQWNDNECDYKRNGFICEDRNLTCDNYGEKYILH